VRVQFEDGQELVADFVVAADGVHSKVRELLELPPVIVSNTTNFRGSLDVPITEHSGKSEASPELISLLEKGIVPMAIQKGAGMYFVLFNFHSKKPGRLAWILATQRGSRLTPMDIARDCLQDPEQLRLLEEIFALSADHHMLPYPKSSITDFSDVVLEREFSDGGWGGTGRVTLIGDAAHGMRPTDGYGGSMAFEDAVALASTLKKGLSSNKRDIPTLLKQFERERRPRVKPVYDNQFERYQQRMERGKPPGPQDPAFSKWLFDGI